LVECNISRNNDIALHGHVNASWLNNTALHAGLTSADMLPVSEVFINIRYIPPEARFCHYAKITEAISPLFSINVLLLLNNIPVLTSFYFGNRFYVRPSNCCVTVMRPDRTRMFGDICFRAAW